MSDNRSTPTLEDVARAAGVSTATVSRCLNRPDRVVAATRDRVMAAVETLGYTPNFAARVMAARRTFTIGAIIPTMENAIFARGLQAFQEALHEKGYTLLVASSAYRPDMEAEQIRALVARGADGLLLIGHDRDGGLYDYLERQGVPALIAWSYAAEAALPSIGFDNRAAMRALTEEVLALGHRRIGVISAMVEGNDRARDRVQGVRDAVGDAPLRVIETTYGVETGAAAFDALMSDEAPPTAVICGNDVLAVGAMTRARERGIAVPRDVSITGFDDLEIARIVAPPLTTVHVPHREMGRRAAHALVAMVEGGGAAPAVELATRMELRGSLGPPP
ncbi:LacI family DNA-binding transcriptional regulator [Jannaschia sp. S6380]|uniref:LacI family DNA-binding transcriptional regulator n=1 Tax=Jannaschia sp. S6380 TaxID=2926408 RepID=UPI001FF1F70E|nr:LacI family DNA-binding transcriptional regulator [Jannaschia sp. S6380]MCK0167697.1 LacI family DNA-binding transcriptional regulator [Jannaschia sp. S6380]